MSQAQRVRRRRLGAIRRKPPQPRVATMTMMEHLAELRDRIIKSALAFVAISVVAFILYGPISSFILEPYCGLPPSLRLGGEGSCQLAIFKPLAGFQFRLKVTALAGVLFSSPVWLYQLWAFITPGLTVREKRYALPFVLTSVSLFLLGSTFAYLALPTGLNLLLRIGGENLQAFLGAEEYLNFVGLMLLAFGVCFELPLVLFFLGLAEIVTVEGLRKQRKGALIAIVLVAAIITPSQDPYTMLVLAAPLYGFYELTIVVLNAVLRRRAVNA